MSLALELTDSNSPTEYTPLQPIDSSVGVEKGKGKSRNITLGPVGAVVLIGLVVALASFGGYHVYEALTSTNKSESNDENLRAILESAQAEMSSKKGGKKKHKSTEAPCKTNCELQVEVEDNAVDIRVLQELVTGIIEELVLLDNLSHTNGIALNSVTQDFYNSPASPIALLSGKDSATGAGAAALNTWDQCPFCTDWWDSDDVVFQLSQFVTVTGNNIQRTFNQVIDESCESVSPRGGFSRRRTMQQGESDIETCVQCFKLNRTKYGLVGLGRTDSSSEYDVPLDFIIPYWNPGNLTDNTSPGTKNGDCPSAYGGTGLLRMYDRENYINFIENNTPITISPAFACGQTQDLPKKYITLSGWNTCQEFLQATPTFV